MAAGQIEVDDRASADVAEAAVAYTHEETASTRRLTGWLR